MSRLLAKFFLFENFHLGKVDARGTKLFFYAFNYFSLLGEIINRKNSLFHEDIVLPTLSIHATILAVFLNPMCKTMIFLVFRASLLIWEEGYPEKFWRLL